MKKLLSICGALGLTCLSAFGQNHALSLKTNSVIAGGDVTNFWSANAVRMDNAITNSWTLAVIPDAQYYSNTVFASMADAIITNRYRLNIPMVLSVGDVVNLGDSLYQWNNSTNLFHDLRAAGMRHLTALGNHDYDFYVLTNDPSTYTSTNFNSYYGLNYLTNQSWWYGQSGSFSTNANNTYTAFRVGGQSWLAFAIEYAPSDAVLSWITNIANGTYPNHDVVLANHTVIHPVGHRLGQWGAVMDGTVHSGGEHAGYNDANQMWEKALKHIPKLRAVFSGHADNMAISRSTDFGVAGNTVHFFLSDYQFGFYDMGTQEGWIRFYTFTPDSIISTLYSSVNSTNNVLPQNQFVVPRKVEHPVDADPALIFHAPLDEVRGTNTLDLVSGWSGSFGARSGNAPVFAPGMIGNAAYFNGEGGSVRFPYYPQLNWAYELSWSIWAKIPASADSGTLISSLTGGTNGSFMVNFYNSPSLTNLLFRINHEDGAQSGTASLPFMADDNAWHHYAGTWDGTNMVIYCDGEESYRTNFASRVFTSRTYSEVWLGDYYGNTSGLASYLFRGYLDDARIWTRALSAKEIASLYDASASDSADTADSPLILHVPFNEGSGTNTADISNARATLTLSNGDASDPWDTGITTYAAFTDGTNQWTLASSTRTAGLSNITLSVWAAMTNLSSPRDFQVLASKHSYSTDGEWALSVFKGTNLNWMVINATPTRLDFEAAASITDTNWHHYAATYDGVTVKVYKDSILLGSTNFTGRIQSTAYPIYIGNTYNASDTNLLTFEGVVDEVRLYNTALTDNEIADIYRLHGGAEWVRDQDAGGHGLTNLTSIELGGVTYTNLITGGSATNAYSIIMDEGGALTPTNTIDFIGVGITASDGVGKTDVTLAAALDALAVNDGSSLTNMLGATNQYQLVNLQQLEDAVSGDEVLFFDTSVASVANGFTLTGTVLATNFMSSAGVPAEATSAAVTAADGNYIVAFISTNTYSSLASGMASVDVWSYENSAGSGSISAEVYVVNSVTMEEEYEFVPAPAFQTVDAGATPVKHTFGVPITDYISSTNFYVMVKIKVSESGVDPTIRIVTGGAYPSHISFALPSSIFLTKSEAAATYAPNTFAGITNALGLFTAGTTQFLREDGTMATPPGGSGATNIDYGSANDYTVSNTLTVLGTQNVAILNATNLNTDLIDGPGITNALYLHADGPIVNAAGTTNVWGAIAGKAPNTFAGVTNALGIFTDGTTQFLREDGTMATPPGGGGSIYVGAVQVTNPNLTNYSGTEWQVYDGTNLAVTVSAGALAPAQMADDDWGFFSMLTGIASIDNPLTGVSLTNATYVAASVVQVDDDPYAAGWDGSTNVPSKNAVYDKIETLSAGTASTNITDNGYVAEINNVTVKTNLVFSTGASRLNYYRRAALVAADDVGTLGWRNAVPTPVGVRVSHYEFSGSTGPNYGEIWGGTGTFAGQDASSTLQAYATTTVATSGNAGITHSGGLRNWYFGRPWYFSSWIYMVNTNNVRMVTGLTRSTGATIAGADTPTGGASQDTAMFRMKDDATVGPNNFVCITYNGSDAAEVTDSGVMIAASTAYNCEAASDGSANVWFWINGTAVATNTTSIPNADSALPFIWYSNATDGSNTKVVAVSWFYGWNANP